MYEFSRNSLIICGFPIANYGIVIASAIALSVFLAMKREKQFGCPKDTVIDLALICIPAAIICARMYYVIFQWEQFSGNLMSIINLRTGGLAIYGGLIGAITAGFIYCRVKKLSFPNLADLAAPSIALGQAIGRWGNFFNQEAYGIEITNPALQFFPLGVFIDANVAWHCATFFYESVWCLGIAVFLLIAHKKGFFKNAGDQMLWYMLLYGLERAMVEGLRTDSLYLGPLRISQALSIILIFAAALIFSLRGKWKNRLMIFGTITSAAAMVLSLFNLIYPALILAAISVVIIALAYTIKKTCSAA